jgi:uncharacterized protein (TIGR03382 family)
MDANPSHPRLARTSNGGRDWEVVDLVPSVPSGFLRIVAVDPADPNRLLLHVLDVQGGDRVILSVDGGRTVTEVARIARLGALTGFLRRDDGSLLLGGYEGSEGLVLVSRDRGATWTRWAHPPHPRAFGERDGKLYVVGDDVQDQFAVAVSERGAEEDGTSLRPLARLASVARMKPCVAAACQAACAYEVSRGNLPPRVCGPGFDGSAPDGLLRLGGVVVVPESSGKGGCHCRLAAPGPPGAAPVIVAALALFLRRRRARRRPGPRTYY